MKTNIGNIDRIVRIIMAILLFGWGLYAQTWLGLIGLIPFITAIVRICPLYVPFKLSTMPQVKAKIKAKK